MNAEKLFKLAMAVLLAATIIGCSDTDNDDGNSSSDQIIPPEIDRITLTVCDTLYCWIPLPSEANAGDQIYVTAWFSDRDSDLRTFYIDHYHESDDFTAIVQSQILQIPATHNPDLHYEFINDPFTASSTTGHWKIRFIAVDAAGNESNEYEVDFFVR
jgi:hypothetical protein